MNQELTMLLAEANSTALEASRVRDLERTEAQVPKKPRVDDPLSLYAKFNIK